MKKIYVAIALSAIAGEISAALPHKKRLPESEKKQVVATYRARELADVSHPSKRTRFSLMDDGEIAGQTDYGLERELERWKRAARKQQPVPLATRSDSSSKEPEQKRAVYNTPSKSLQLPERNLPLIAQKPSFDEAERTIIFAGTVSHELGITGGIPKNVHSTHNTQALTFDGDVYDIPTQKLLYSFPVSSHWYPDTAMRNFALLGSTTQSLFMMSAYYKAPLYLRRIGETIQQAVLFPLDSTVTKPDFYTFDMSNDATGVIAHSKSEVFFWPIKDADLALSTKDAPVMLQAYTISKHPDNVYEAPIESAHISRDGKNIVIVERHASTTVPEPSHARQYYLSQYDLYNGEPLPLWHPFPRKLLLSREGPYDTVKNTFENAFLSRDHQGVLQLVRVATQYKEHNNYPAHKITIDALNIETAKIVSLYQKYFRADKQRNPLYDPIDKPEEPQFVVVNKPATLVKSRNNNYIAFRYTPVLDNFNAAFGTVIKRIQLYPVKKSQPAAAPLSAESIRSLVLSPSVEDTTAEEETSSPSSGAGEGGSSSSSSSDDEALTPRNNPRPMFKDKLAIPHPTKKIDLIFLISPSSWKIPCHL